MRIPYTYRLYLVECVAIGDCTDETTSCNALSGVCGTNVKMEVVDSKCSAHVLWSRDQQQTLSG